ncbi:MAG: endonuclease III [Eubacteriales bacterium]|jgi:endonuclease-3
MRIKEKVTGILDTLDARYGVAECSLTYQHAWQLLVAVRLSAQCTDARVNLVTPVLFEAYPTLESLAQADPLDVMEIVKPCGFYKVKGQNIVDMSRMLLENYGGQVPDTIEELVKLPGVGRKTANLICGDVYGKPAIVADTHCIRISNRLGLCKDLKEPEKVEKRLKAIIPPERSNNFCHQLVWYGREICTARSPKCGECPLALYCDHFHKGGKPAAKKTTSKTTAKKTGAGQS